MLYEHVNKHIDIHDAFASGILSVFRSLFLSLQTRKLGTATPPPISNFIFKTKGAGAGGQIRVVYY